MGGEHGHRSHADEQGEGQAVQGALHPWKGEEGALSWAAPGAPTVPSPSWTRGTGVMQTGTVTASCATLGEPLDFSEPPFLHL